MSQSPPDPASRAWVHGPDLAERHPIDVDSVFGRAARDLAIELGTWFSVETIHELIDDSYDRLAATATVYTHLPVLAVRFARQRLESIATARGVIVSARPEVLFVCVHNAGRSQMAAALLHHHAQRAVTVRSAGSAPAASINPAVAEVMTEIGLDLSQEFPKPLTDESVQAADVVITMGCGDACPVYPGKRYLNWELDDPAGKTAEQIRPIRDEIDRRVIALLAELVPTPS
jgi:protein-tyrosine-phosphatase